MHSRTVEDERATGIRRHHQECPGPVRAAQALPSRFQSEGGIFFKVLAWGEATGQERAPDAVRIVLTAYTDVDSLMEAINTGRIYHFVPKPWDPNELLLVVRRAAERWRMARENTRLRDELELAYNALRRETTAGREKPASFDKLVGAETGLRGAVELARKVLDGDTTVLLLGETGTGKEVLARAIHALSRRPGPFVAVNCGALPDELVEAARIDGASGMQVFRHITIPLMTPVI